MAHVDVFDITKVLIFSKSQLLLNKIISLSDVFDTSNPQLRA